MPPVRMDDSQSRTPKGRENVDSEAIVSRKEPGMPGVP